MGFKRCVIHFSNHFECLFLMAIKAYRAFLWKRLIKFKHRLKEYWPGQKSTETNLNSDGCVSTDSYSSLLNTNKYVYGKCRFIIVISCRCMSLLTLLFSYSKWFKFQKVFLSDLFCLAKTLE